ncbi:MAG: hypothetical protein JNK21_13425 [Rhodospirillaceae bacterium]|nr:hypothetical protein [Rhodospirillaceae bacterium]
MARQPAWHAKIRSALRLAQSQPDVMGVDYGYVSKDGAPIKTLGVRFHVRRKLPLAELSPSRVLPKTLDDLRCDVIEASYGLSGSPRVACNPVQMGVSIGNVERTSTGSFGVLVRDKQSSTPAVLSNWHVLCGSPQASVNDRISQPGPRHLGSQPARVVAHLERWLSLDTGIDAAIALLESGIPVHPQLFESTAPVSGIEAPKPGMKLVKYGAASGLTHGKVDGVGGMYKIDYSYYGDAKRWMEGVRLICDPDFGEDEISLSGDSGAAWVNPQSGKAVALHFAGEDGLGATAEYALAHPLQRIFGLLDLDAV